MSTHDASARILLRHLIDLLAQGDTDTVPPQVCGLRFAVACLATAALLDAAARQDHAHIDQAQKTAYVLDSLPTDAQWQRQRDQMHQAGSAAAREERDRWVAGVRKYLRDNPDAAAGHSHPTAQPPVARKDRADL